jgi:ferredoxin
MNVEIYYFSGTGNSFDVASTISEKLNAKMIPIIRLLNEDVISSKAEVIGFVFPIYDFKAPEIVNDFIKKLSAPADAYFFAICTYGVKPLKTMKKLEKVFSSVDKKLSAGFAVQMPHNGLGYSSISVEKQQKMFKQFEKKSDMIAQFITSRKQGVIEKSNVIDYIVLLGIFIRLMPMIFPMLKQALVKGWDSLGFYADKTCNSCGICSNVCPVNNISLVDGKPCWDDHCLNCFACFHWCPQQSIQIANLTKKMNRYHHPDVKLIKIVNQKKYN